MPERKVIVREGKAKRAGVPDVDAAWRWIGWFGLLLAAMGLGDFAIAWYPLNLGSPEWEFGTIAASFAGLPLVTMGFAGLLGSALARGRKGMVVGLGWGLGLFGVMVITALLLFLLDVPIALRAAPNETVLLGLKKAIAKTTMLGVGFSVGYLVAAVGAVRHIRAKG